MELDGRPVTADQLAALALVNYGHFTSMLVEGGRVRGLALHWQRLVTDCRTMFDTELDPDRLRALVRRLDLPPAALVRVTVFAPDLPLAEPARQAAPRILVSTRPAGTARAAPVRLRSVAYQRELPTVKHVGLCGAVWQRRRVQRAGADDVLFVDPSGAVCEGATWNVGFLDDRDRIVWPTGDCLSGVTMRLLDAACAGHGRQPLRRDLRLPEVLGMRAAFVTNAAVGVRAVASIDGTGFAGAGPLLSSLAELYAAVPGEPL